MPVIKDWKRELRKKWKQRLLLAVQYFSLATAIYLVLDESVKEGYYFRLDEITLIPSHEFLITLLLTISVITGVVRWRVKTSSRKSRR